MGVNYQRVQTGDIAVGKPVPWALYDENRHLLLARGVRLESERQLNALMERGLFRIIPTISTSTAPVDEAAAAPAQKQDIRQLEDIRLAIGDMLQLQGRVEGDRGRHYVRLIGFLKGKAVLVTTPTAHGQVLLMREGQAFVVRLFAGKSAYAFATNVQRVTTVPFPHMYLEYPREVRGLVVRQGARAKVQIIAAVIDSAGRSHAANIVDISVGGAMLVAKAPLSDRNSTVAIKFRVEINGVEQYLSIDGVIRNIHAEQAADHASTVYQHGVKFEGLAPGDQVSLSGFVYQTLLEQSTEL